MGLQRRIKREGGNKRGRRRIPQNAERGFIKAGAGSRELENEGADSLFMFLKMLKMGRICL